MSALYDRYGHEVMYHDHRAHPEPDILGVPHLRHHHFTCRSGALGNAIIREVVIW
jgi:hypothetical protein